MMLPPPRRRLLHEDMNEYRYAAEMLTARERELMPAAECRFRQDIYARRHAAYFRRFAATRVSAAFSAYAAA